ncbi:MAG: NADH-quinone oxidoreductase subunit L [Anaerolineales bacterium]|nr:NADH-quinone oxidoreductase subunit L [Anaerolineales bacterium]
MLAILGLPWLGAAVIWLAGDRRPDRLHRLAVAFSAAGGLAALGLLPQATDEVALRLSLGGVFGDFTLVPDGLGVLVAAIASVIGCLAIVFATDYMQHGHQLARFYSLTLLFIGAMAGLALSGSLLLTFLFWEITALCSYALISFHNDDPRAVAGGLKALVMTQVGGIGLLVGALLAYAWLGDYQISTFLARAGSLPEGVLGLIAFGFLLAAAAKSAQVPLHSWLPDAMEAPTPVTALIHAATMVNAGVYLLARFYPAFSSVPHWRLAVMVVGALSALLAGLMALACGDIKRVLAYSTISQLGFMVYAVGSGALFASQFHLLSHAIFKALLFLAAGALITALGTRDLCQMGGLGRRMPFVRTVFVIGACGLVGLPLANGFFSKDLILEGGLEGGPAWLYAGMLVSVGLTAAYSLRLVGLVFGGERRGPDPAHDARPAMRLALALLAFGTLSSWLLAGPLGRMLAGTLPAHSLEAVGTWRLVGAILAHPATWGTLAVVALGFALWAGRRAFTRLARALAPLLEGGLGFEWLNRQIVDQTRRLAALVQRSQTGQLNWNAAAILAGLLAAAAVLLAGGRP